MKTFSRYFILASVIDIDNMLIQAVVSVERRLLAFGDGCLVEAMAEPELGESSG